MHLFYNNLLEGLMIGALLSAIVSSIAAQIIAATSSIVEDIYHYFINKKAKNKNLVIISRISIILIAMLSCIISINPQSSILNKISFAWAGMGASFGPIILISLLV